MRYVLRHLPLLGLGLVALGGCGGAEKKAPATPTSQAAKAPETAKTYDKQSTGATFDTGAPKPAPPAADGAAKPATDAPAAAAGPIAVDPTQQTTQAESYLRAGRYEDAIRECRLALGRNERFVPAMVVMAKAYYHLGRRDQAVYVLNTRVLEPLGKGELSVDGRDLAEIYNLLGLVALRKGFKEEALKKFREATQKNPQHAASWVNLCALLVQQKDYGAAVAAGEQAVRLAPSLAKAHLNLGSAYRGQKAYEKATGELRRALELQADYPEAYYDLGLVYLDAETYPGMSTTDRLEMAVKMLLEYKGRARARGLGGRDDTVDELIKRANSDLKDERKAIERKRKKAEDAAKRGQPKAPEEAGAKPPAAPAAKPAAKP